MFQKITQIMKIAITLMIPNGKGYYYITVKKLLQLLRGITELPSFF